MLKDINKIESICASKIADYEFVGELALTKDEYEHYSSIFSDKCIILENDSYLLYRLPYKTVLVVLAVNCAYFEIRGKPYLIAKLGFNTPLLAALQKKLPFDTPSACGGVVHFKETGMMSPRIHMKIYQNRIKVR